MTYWITFINERNDRVTLTEEITNFPQLKAWQKRVNRTKHSNKIKYIGDGKED